MIMSVYRYLLLLFSFFLAQLSLSASFGKEQTYNIETIRGISVPPFVSSQVIENVKKMGFNTVRIHIVLDFLVKKYGLSPREALDISLGQSIWLINKYKDLNFILSFDSYPYKKGLCNNERSEEFWENKECIENLFFIVRECVRKTHSLENLIGYEFMSEPVILKKVSGHEEGFLPKNWRTFVLPQIVRSIRKYTHSKYIFVSPGPGGGPKGYKDFKPLKDSRIVYNLHFYLPHKYTHQGLKGRKYGLIYPGKIGFRYWNKELLEHELLPVVFFKEKYKVPVCVTEFSVVRWAPNKNKYLLDLLNLFNKYHFGWLYFSIGGFKAWDPRYDLVVFGRKSGSFMANLNYIGYNSTTIEILKSNMNTIWSK